MKKYTSKQEYAAFYWDGRNFPELEDWLKNLNVVWLITVEYYAGVNGVEFAVKQAGDLIGTLDYHPKWVVVSTSIDIVVNVLDVETFNKFFVEVSE